MSLLALLSQPGVIVARSQTGPEDVYGTPTWENVDVPVRCHVQPAPSGANAEHSELEEAASAGVSVWKGWFPAGTLLDPADAVLLDDGRKFEVVGPPRPWVNPSTGTEQFVEVSLKRVERFEEEESEESS
jgi:hypothetical protein